MGNGSSATFDPAHNQVTVRRPPARICFVRADDARVRLKNQNCPPAGQEYKDYIYVNRDDLKDCDDVRVCP